MGIWVQKVVQSCDKVFYLNYWEGEGKGCGHSEMHNRIKCSPKSGVGQAWLHAKFGASHPALWRAARAHDVAMESLYCVHYVVEIWLLVSLHTMKAMG